MRLRHQMAASRPVRVRAFAKINLTLRVLGRRSDGYHELRTTFQSITLHDTLEFVRTGAGFSIACDDPRCPADSSNLVWRAAEALWSVAGRNRTMPGTAVRIKKRIPIQAGLGGGSSDAAAALRALPQLWRIRVPDSDLHAMARQIGADVPFFLDGGTTLGLERGDLLFPLLDWPDSRVVLVLPAFGVGTREAFGWWDDDSRRGTTAAPGESDRVPEEFRNDLELAVAARHPEIGRIVQGLAQVGASYAAMSGSGSAVFGLFDGDRQARDAATRLAGAGRRTLVSRTLSRRKYRPLAAPYLV